MKRIFLFLLISVCPYSIFELESSSTPCPPQEQDLRRAKTPSPESIRDEHIWLKNNKVDGFYRQTIISSQQIFSQHVTMERLAGCWQDLSDSTHFEVWENDSSLMKGMWLKMVSPDSFRIRKRLEIMNYRDTLRYRLLSQKDTAEFTLTLFTEGELIFTNSKRIFPKVIHYRLLKNDLLEVEMYDDSYRDRIEIFYRRKSTLPLRCTYPEDRSAWPR